jgi:hypothetical protein
MLFYINGVAKRLARFGETLNKKEVFVDLPWAYVDEEGKNHKYYFKRNGQLIMALEGVVSKGNWEFLPSSNSFILEQPGGSRLYETLFADTHVLILKKDGSEGALLPLVNSNLIPYNQLCKHLEDKYISYNNAVKVPIEEGGSLFIENWEGGYDRNLVWRDIAEVEDGWYTSSRTGNRILVENGRAIDVMIQTAFETNKGKILVEHLRSQKPSIGDAVWQNGQAAKDGRYRVNLLQTFVVRNGRLA